MDLCLFQGTFNPIHNAHLRVANYVINNNLAKKIVFIPAWEPPHKTLDENLSKHRFNMVKLAISNNPSFEISDIEYKRKGKSYTYLTICELKDRYKLNDKINFIIGTDAFRKIETWYEIEKLKNMLHFLIFYRDVNFDENEFTYLKNKDYDFEFLPLEFEDISSSDIRQSISNGIYPQNKIPKEIEEYIKNNDLYRN